MSPEALATLLADPDRAATLSRGDVAEVLGQLERLRATLWCALTAPTVPNGGAPEVEPAGEDRLLTVKELAERLNVDDRWVYRRADDFTFTRRLSDRTLRFSERGLERWLERQGR